ncbi:MAG: insulinase family protein [Planctomycetes bacterium]|nr:insulinase family protein [Planctomycetota bacterium]
MAARWSLLLGTLTALSLSSCWRNDFAGDQRYAPPDRPRVGPAPRAWIPGDQAKTAPGATPPKGIQNSDNTKSVTPPEPVREPVDGEDLHTFALPGPVAINVRIAPPRSRLLAERAVVRIDLRAGFTNGLPGLAELVALAVSETADGAAGRPALNAVIQRLGGRLNIEVGAQWTTITAAVPAVSWEEALRAMVERIHQQPLSHAWLASLQDRLIKHKLSEWRIRPALSEADRWVRYGAGSREAIVHAIEDRNLPEVVLFQRRYYRPRNAAVGLWVPGAPKDATFLLERAKAAMIPWRQEPEAPMVGADRKYVPPGGVLWLEGEGEPRVALIVPCSPQTPPSLILGECYSMDGIGGRLGELAAIELGFEPVFQVHELGNFNERFTVYECDLPAARVVKFWETAQAAWRSLGDRPPTGQELRAGLDRARLQLLQRQDHAESWFQATSLRLLRLEPGGPSHDLTALDKLTTPDIAATARQWAKAPLALVVVGGSMPADAPPTFRRGSAAIPSYSRAPQSETEGTEDKAKRYLDLAVKALGEPRLFRGIGGYVAVESLRDEDGLTVQMRTTFRFPDKLERTTEVLGSSISTKVDGTTGRESAGQELRTLTAGEAVNLLHEASRNPVVLIAGYAQGTLRFRYVGQRSRYGRRVALLELIDDTHPRLRMTIDVQSGLPRSVETSSHRPGVGPVQERDYYDDYRRMRGIRVPMHRVSSIDTEPLGIEATFRSFEILPR